MTAKKDKRIFGTQLDWSNEKETEFYFEHIISIAQETSPIFFHATETNFFGVLKLTLYFIYFAIIHTLQITKYRFTGKKWWGNLNETTRFIRN